jgi:hypothetical protein
MLYQRGIGIVYACGVMKSTEWLVMLRHAAGGMREKSISNTLAQPR